MNLISNENANSFTTIANAVYAELSKKFLNKSNSSKSFIFSSINWKKFIDGKLSLRIIIFNYIINFLNNY